MSKEQEKGLTVQEGTKTVIAGSAQPKAFTIDLSDDVEDIGKKLDELEEKEKEQKFVVDEMRETWSPEAIGESKLLIFYGGVVERLPDMTNPEIKKDVPFALFYEPKKGSDGKVNFKQIAVSSSRIVTFFLDTIGSREEGLSLRGVRDTVQEGAVYRITFTGEEKSKKNSTHKIRCFSINRIANNG